MNVSKTTAICAAIAAMLTLGASRTAVATTLTVPGNASDARINYPGGGNPPPGISVANVTSPSVSIYANNGFGGTSDGRAILVFQLPDLGPVVNPFTAATFSVGGQYAGSLTSANTVAALTLLNGTAAASTVITNYLSTAGTGLGNIMTAYSWVGVSDSNMNTNWTTRSVSGTTLVNALNAAYGSGAGANQFVFFRLQADNGYFGSTGSYFNIGMSENTDASRRPTLSLTLAVSPTNTAPTLPTQADQTIDPLTTLVVTNTATDLDLPGQTLTYSLLAAPATAVISTNGVITWNTTLSDAQSTNVITTVVTDNGTPPLSATNSFVVVVREYVNTPPVLPAQADRTNYPLTTLVVTNTATDSDVPAQVLSYSLLVAPASATISSNGVITWSPTQTDALTTNVITTVVTDNGFPPLSATNSFTAVVLDMPTNVPPVLPAQADRNVAPMTTLIVTNNATDADLPAQDLTYSLSGAPSGMTIDTNGVIRWTPTANQGPATNVITTVVTDNGIPPLSASNTFTVYVAAPNTAPVLPSASIQTIAALTTLRVTNTATDSDVPAQTLTYQLVNPINEPALGASIDTNGVITWTPAAIRGPGRYSIRTRVTDNGVPPLSATNIITVLVTPAAGTPVRTNLLTVNPSFESGSFSTYANGAYSFTGWSGYNYTYNGNYTLAGGATDGNQLFHFHFAGRLQTAADSRPTAAPGALYEMRYELRTPFNSNPSYFLGTSSYLEFFDAAGNKLKSYWGPDWWPVMQPNGTYDWETVVVRGVAPPGTSTVGVRADAPDGVYPNVSFRNVEVDNFRIYQIEQPLDRLAVRRAKQLVEPGKTSTLAIWHLATAPRTLAVRLVSSAGSITAETTVPVTSGRALDYVDVTMPTNLPAGSYSWQIGLLPQGGEWNQAVVTKTVGGVFSDETPSLPDGGGSSFDADHTNLVYMGRWNTSNPKQRWMYWFGSEVRLRFTGTSLSLRGSVGDNGYGGPTAANLAVIIDGNTTNSISVSLSQFNATFPLVSNLTAGVHTARLFKSGETDQQIRVDGFILDAGCGLLRPEPLPNQRIEIYGDSVTSGGSASPSFLAYAPLLGTELNADVHIISKGGTGVAASFSGLDILLNYWDNLSFPNVFNASTGLPWNTANWTPDAVVIAIGHNDQFNNGYIKFNTNYWQFSAALRAAYPAAPIISLNTLISAPIGFFDSAINPICAVDTNHFFAMQLNPWTDPNTGHPPTPAHNAMVYGTNNVFSMADLVEQKTGWDVSGPLTGYEQWVINQFSAAEISQGLQSPATTVGTGGGVNLLRYALGLSAHGALSPTSQPQARFDGAGHFTYSFYRAAADVTYVVQTSDDLVNWQSVATNPGSVGSIVQFTDPTLPLVSHRFARLLVIPNW